MTISISKINSEEEAIVISRVLLSVNKAIEKHFPNASTTDARFSKTVFSAEESTALNRTNSDKLMPKQADSEEEAPKSLTKFKRTEEKKQRDWLAILTILVFLVGLFALVFLFMV